VNGGEVLGAGVEAHEVDGVGRQEELVRGVEDHLPAKIIALKPAHAKIELTY
jgi:hypothetical protein